MKMLAGPHGELITPKRGKVKEDPDNEDHEVKRWKEFELWEDLKNLMSARIPRGNCRTRDEGTSNPFCRRMARDLG